MYVALSKNGLKILTSTRANRVVKYKMSNGNLATKRADIPGGAYFKVLRLDNITNETVFLSNRSAVVNQTPASMQYL